jgi:DNA-binding transcriptional LysR family regulator
MRICDRSVCDHMDVDLDPAHLRSFLAVVRFGTYHRAADVLHMTQPAISRHMRLLERRLGAPLFVRRGRGVELTPYGERAATELGKALAAHDTALARLQRGGDGSGPFVLGATEGLVDPILPNLIATVRQQLARPLRLRVDRSLPLVECVERGEVDAAVVLNPGDAQSAVELGTLTLFWWGAPALAAARKPPEPLPLVTYDVSCAVRNLAFRRLRELDLEPNVTAESLHLTGIQTAVRHGLGYALLPAGGDGIRAVAHGPLATPIHTPLWLVLAAEHRALVRPLRAALARATAPHTLPKAA